jgi:tetratricopeptide (TPR) repeat protein
MKRYLLAVHAAILPFIVFSQQPSAKDLEKLLKQAQQQAPASANESIDDDEDFKAPKKNTALLAAIPKKLFTTAELAAYVKTLVKKFETSRSNQKTIAYVKKSYPEKNKTDYSRLCILLWYSGRQNEAVYVALRAAVSQPGDLLTLSNLCAFLNMSGYPHKSIPVLKHALSRDPNNTFLLNNCGQAYYQLGDMTTSSQYLGSCTRIDPYHVEANNTQGHIATAQGNTAAANTFYENSIKGGYNQSAADRLKQNRPDRRVEDIMEWPEPAQYPETDDNIPFQCPQIPTDPALFPAHDAKMEEEAAAWSKAQEEYREKINESMAEQGQQMANALMSGRRPVVTMGVMHRKAGMAIGEAYASYFDLLKKIEKEYAEWKEEFDKRWVERMRDACRNAGSEEACCEIMRGLESQKQSERSQRFNSYCSASWANVKGFYNCIAYWKPLFIQQRGLFDKDLYTARVAVLGAATNLIRGTGIHNSSLCQDAIEPGEIEKNINFKDPECKLSVKIPLGIGGIELGCDKFKASFGEGIIGEIELNFKTFQSTIALGVGAQAQTGIVNAGVGAMHYITFDGDFNVTDWGHRVQAGVGVAELTGDKLGLNALSADATLSVGVNSGVNSSVGINAFNQTLLSGEANLYSFSKN